LSVSENRSAGWRLQIGSRTCGLDSPRRPTMLLRNPLICLRCDTHFRRAELLPYSHRPSATWSNAQGSAYLEAEGGQGGPLQARPRVDQRGQRPATSSGEGERQGARTKEGRCEFVSRLHRCSSGLGCRGFADTALDERRENFLRKVRLFPLEL
jgi:hypothetical protein